MKLNFTIKQLEILRKQAKIPKSIIKDNIKSIRIGHLTYIKDQDFKDYTFKKMVNQ